jgi:YidC/Oxa1 family membrane protein insertase
MTQQQRLLLAIALSFGLMLAFTNFVTKPAAEEEAARLAALDGGARLGMTEVTDGAVLLPVIAAASPTAAGADAGVPSTVAATASAAPELPLRLLDVERPTTQLTFTSEGAGLTNAVLKGQRERVEQTLSIADGYRKMLGGKFPPPAHVDMAEPVPSGAPQLAVSIAGVTPVAPTQRYAVAEEGPGLLGFVATVGPFEIHKVFRWSPTATTSEKDPTGYLSTMEVTVKNTSSVAAGGDLVVHTTRSVAPGSEEAPSMFGGIGNESTVVCQVGDDTKRERPSDDAVAHEDKGAVSFVGIDQTYFLTAVWPTEGAADGRCVLTASKLVRSAELAVPLALPAGQAVTKTFGVFIGPKDLELLTAIAKHAPAAGPVFDPKLDKTVDFGWWAAICRILIFFLRMFHNLAGNWGVAIILLTVMVKVLLLPLTHKAMVSAEQMKKLSPRMEELKKKYPDDRDRQNTEMMKLYQEAKVNPLGGCLPLLVQLPIWAALFTTLRTSYELYGEPFFGVWSDLTSKDPTYLLPLALGITMIVTQRLQPQMTMDKSQAFLMAWVMPIFFTAIMINYPAGLALYIFTNNLLSIIQQYALRKYMARSQPAAAGAAR